MPPLGVAGQITTATGKNVYFDPADRRGQDLARSHGVLTPLSLTLWNIALRLHQWDLIIDVGCNYGEMLVSAELPVESQLVAFEPNPRVLPYLRRTLSEFGRPVDLIERAVADEPRDAATFVIDEDWSGTSGLPRHIPEQMFGHDHTRTVTSVPVTTLDAQFAMSQPASACIKIDVEGYERAVLEGARQLLGRARHWAVVLEVLHMREDALSELASRHPVYVLSTESLGLVRLQAGDADQIHRQMANALIYPQDALMLSASLPDRAEVSVRPGHSVHTPVRHPGHGLRRATSEKPRRAHSLPRRVVYTALIGQYERLNDQPISGGSPIDFVCLTDDPELVSDTWTIRLVDPRFPRDSIRSARYLKVMGPELLEDYDESLWIDNTIVLRTPPESILDEWLADVDLALPLHSFRDTVAAEFDAVEENGYDDPRCIFEQLVAYAAMHPAVLDEKPYATGFMARRHTNEVRAAMRLWYEHILRYSRRDQLSLNYVLSATGLPAAGIPIDLYESRFHQWPVCHERKTHVTHGRLRDVLNVPHAEIGRLENFVASLRTALAAEESRRHEMQSTEARLRAELVEQDQESERQLRLLIGELSAVRDELSLIQSSTCWRMTRPIRWLSSRLPDRARRVMRGIV